MTYRASSAIQTILVHGKRAYIYFRLIFRVSANLAVWCGFSEIVCNISNKITLIGDLNPDLLYRPIQPKVPAAVYIDPLIPIAPAKAITVEVPTTLFGRVDCFLDDTITVFLNCLVIIKRNTALVPLAMHVLMRPLSKDEPVPRRRHSHWTNYY